MATETVTATRTVQSTINYFAPDGRKIVFPGTAGYQRRKFDPRTVTVTDIRGTEDQYTLERNGFQVVKHEWTPTKVDDTNERVEGTAYLETVELLKRLTGATHVKPFSYQIRRQTGEQVKEMAEGLEDSDVLPSAGPTHFAHCDNSKVGSRTVLKENVPEEEFEKRQQSRWAIMNVWRPVERPVTREPLAMLDAQTVKEDEFEGVFASLPRPGQGAFDNIYHASKGFEIAQIRANDAHRWYYVAGMELDEALVFKQWDSATDGRARQTPHCAIHTGEDHGPVRQSIEVRTLLFWEEESAG